MTNIFIAGDSRAGICDSSPLIGQLWVTQVATAFPLVNEPNRSSNMWPAEHHEAFRNLKIIIYLESKQRRSLEKLFDNI